MVYWPLNPKEAVLKETSELLPSSSTALLASTVHSDVQVHPSDTTTSSLLVTPFPCYNKNTAQLLNLIVYFSRMTEKISGWFYEN